MPVTPLFRHFICEAKPEKCPFVIGERSQAKDTPINDNNQVILRRRP